MKKIPLFNCNLSVTYIPWTVHSKQKSQNTLMRLIRQLYFMFINIITNVKYINKYSLGHHEQMNQENVQTGIIINLICISK